MKACGHLRLGEMGLGVVAAEEEVVEIGYCCGENVVDAWEDWDVEVRGVGCAVVE